MVSSFLLGDNQTEAVPEVEIVAKRRAVISLQKTTKFSGFRIQGEHWKEVTTVARSSVITVIDNATGDNEVHLSQHNDRAGLLRA